ncbi:dioxygenase [Microbacterium atlanticum]|uniref:dioxygenase n=1 Tax=Microbacterium atlanticum TaxID=2782168 RepID=UPI001888A14C|nr:dioxygenase [Microbacterium atlanticum]
MATGGKDRGTRAAKERARLYQARQEFHQGQARRRRRDNLVAGIAGGALVLVLIGAQTLYFVAGPGAPAPSPATTSTPAPTPAPTEPAPQPTPTTTSEPTPSPSAS